MNICIHVEYLVVMDMHFFHIMEKTHYLEGEI